MERYKRKFPEAVNSIDDFNKLIEGLLKKSFDEMVQKISDSIYNVMNRYENSRLSEFESLRDWIKRTRYQGYEIDVLRLIYSHKDNHPKKEIIKSKDYEKVIFKYSSDYATEVQTSYRNRLHQKLFTILKYKELKDVKIISLKMKIFYEAVFHFLFEDGSQFTLQSQIVLSTSSKGTLFYRFPNLYQNIVMSDGTRIKKQSEEWMLVNFAGADPNILSQKTQDDKLKKQTDRKLYSQVQKLLGIQNERNRDIVSINDDVVLDVTRKKYIKSVITNNKIVYKQNPTVAYKDMRFYYPDNTRIIITYIDDTKIEVKISGIQYGDDFKSSVILNDKKINGNLGIEFYYFRGIITKIFNLGEFTQKLV